MNDEVEEYLSEDEVSTDIAETPQEPSFRTLTQDDVEKINKKIADITAQYTEHKYTLEYSKDTFDSLLSFMKNDAAFDGREAKGIVNIIDELEEIGTKGVLNQAAGTPRYLITNFVAQAVYHFLLKRTGIGLDQAKEHLVLLEPIYEVLERADQRHRVLDGLREQLVKQLQGIIDPDTEIKFDEVEE